MIMSDIYDKEQEDLFTKLSKHGLPLYEKDFPLIFFWSPKSGCTSLIRWFFFQIGQLQKANDYHPWVHMYRMEVYEKQNDYTELKRQLLEGPKVTYKLVRNPYKRAVSSFLAMLTNKLIMEEIKLNPNDSISFKQFLYQINKIGIDRDLINSHIAQQYVEGEEVFVRSYLHLEKFGGEIESIEKKYGLLKSPILDLTKSHHHMTQIMTLKGEFAETKFKEQFKLGTFSNPLPTYESFYDDETMDLVKKIFQKDFEAYGYNKSGLK